MSAAVAAATAAAVANANAAGLGGTNVASGSSAPGMPTRSLIVQQGRNAVHANRSGDAALRREGDEVGEDMAQAKVLATRAVPAPADTKPAKGNAAEEPKLQAGTTPVKEEGKQEGEQA